MMARRKNRIENGIRAEFLGSNPHSKGDSFSRSIVDRLFKIKAASITIIARTTAIEVDISQLFINQKYISINLLIKSQVLYKLPDL